MDLLVLLKRSLPYPDTIYSLLSTYVMNEFLWVIPNSPQPDKLHENIWTVMISVPNQLLSSSEIETSKTHRTYIYLFTYFIFQSALWISILVLVQVPTREQDRLRDLIGLSSTLPYRGWFKLSDPCCITNLNLVALLSSVLSWYALDFFLLWWRVSQVLLGNNVWNQP